MRLLDTECDLTTIKSNLEELADLMRMMLHKENQEIFELLDYSNDRIFLEPSLFHYFMEGKKREKVTSLENILFGYLPNEKRNGKRIKVYSDSQGVIYFPNFGYLQASPAEEYEVVFNGSEVELFKESVLQKFQVLPRKIVKETRIDICLHDSEFLAYHLGTSFDEPVVNTANRYHHHLEKGYGILKGVSPEFCSAVELTTREIMIFNSPQQESMAAMSHYGTAFLNVQNQDHNEVFFIDDISHQCGHVIFYALTLDTDKYLKLDKNTLMSNITHVDWETRSVYGGFHGLFTYTCIVDSLTKCIESGNFEGRSLHELQARLGVYMDKFRKDLSNMGDNKIFTKHGFDFYDMFKSGYDRVYDKYKYLIREFDYELKNYTFNYNEFRQLNPVGIQHQQ